MQQDAASLSSMRGFFHKMINDIDRREISTLLRISLEFSDLNHYRDIIVAITYIYLLVYHDNSVMDYIQPNIILWV